MSPGHITSSHHWCCPWHSSFQSSLPPLKGCMFGWARVGFFFPHGCFFPPTHTHHLLLVKVTSLWHRYRWENCPGERNGMAPSAIHFQGNTEETMRRRPLHDQHLALVYCCIESIANIMIMPGFILTTYVSICLSNCKLSQYVLWCYLHTMGAATV